MNINFEKASVSHIDIIFNWLKEPHMIQFWDNSQEHKNDILNFILGNPQTYFAGTMNYWIGLIGNEPYAFVLSNILAKDQVDLSPTQLANMSEIGHTIALDFGIGNKEYLGRGLAATTLSEFMHFYKKNVDPKADTFFIDPDENNPKAVQVYNKAGFIEVGQFQATQGAFIGSNNTLMVKKS